MDRSPMRLLSIVGALLGAVVLLAACATGGPDATAEVGGTPPATEVGVLPTPTRTPAAIGLSSEVPTIEPAVVSVLDAIRERGAVRVGVLYNYPPLGFLAENGTVDGYEVDLMRKISEYWGVEVEPVQVTRQTRLSMLQSGEIDVIAAAMPHRRELGEFVLFTDTIFAGGYSVLVRAEGPVDVPTALAGGTVAVFDPAAAEAVRQQAQGAGLSPNVMFYDSANAAVDALLADPGLSAVIGRRERLMLPDQSNEAVRVLDDLLLYEPYAFAVRRGDIPMRDLLNNTLRQIIDAGEIGTIFSTNFYGIASDVFPVRLGESSVDFASFPSALPTGESVLARILRGDPLRVAGLEMSDDPVLFDSQPIFDGYNRAVLNEMARRWGIGVIEIPDSLGPAGLAQLDANTADLVVGIRPDLSLVGQVEFSQPYYQRGLRVIHMGDVLVLGVGDLEFKPSLAVTPVDISQDIIEDNNQFPQVEIAGSYEDAFEALTARGVYAVVGDEYALTLMAQADDRLEIVDTRYRPTDYVMALPRHDPDFLDLVNYTLQDMYLDGTLDRLRQQYYGPYLPEGAELEDLTLEVWPGDGGYLGVGG